MHNFDVDTLIPTYQIRFGATQPVRVLCTLLRARATVTGARRAFFFFFLIGFGLFAGTACGMCMNLVMLDFI